MNEFLENGFDILSNGSLRSGEPIIAYKASTGAVAVKIAYNGANPSAFFGPVGTSAAAENLEKQMYKKCREGKLALHS